MPPPRKERARPPPPPPSPGGGGGGTSNARAPGPPRPPQTTPRLGPRRSLARAGASAPRPCAALGRPRAESELPRPRRPAPGASTPTSRASSARPARGARRESRRVRRRAARTPPALRPRRRRRRRLTAAHSPQVAAGPSGAAMGRGVRVLLLLGLLHWAGGGEGRKTWRRRSQQPPPPPQRAEAAAAAGQPVESFPLDFTAVEGNMDSFMAQVKSLAQSLYPCSAQQLNEDLRLHLLLNTSVTCNDGSPAGYYLKESKGSRRWLLFLEGGWYCFNRENCDSRYDTMRRLMSSRDWPRTRTGTGILSSQPEENPHWWNANMVFIPYCSSDVWSGASSKSDKSESSVLPSVPLHPPRQGGMAGLLRSAGFCPRGPTNLPGPGPSPSPPQALPTTARTPLPSTLAGSAGHLGAPSLFGAWAGGQADSGVSGGALRPGLMSHFPHSAGGTGVLLNVDRVAEQLEALGYAAIQVRGLADSGWFLDNKQYLRTDCVDTATCAPTEAVRRGIRYWNGVVPERCRRQFKEGEEWNCFFGYKVYPTLRCPVFVVQWLFDEAQLAVDNVHLTGQPVQEGQWLYIQNLGRELRSTLKDVSASFAPACLSHEIIIRSHWTDVQVKGTSLPRALHCWDRSLHDSHKASKAPLKGCPVHLVDSCPWPHCNPSCPTIRDQFTGQEMNVAQFLMHMGLDVQTMAQQQGLEPSKLLGMLGGGS
ncbi:palmitoleoyl-protein carboxylesterase NOTUM [Pteropus medius]|uniref:palmitoleoyl-protein carboxylesterase NOTUM n=1 Tax=Pteropus vampyrus TaxID=132908 RepID=UPI00196A4DD3|nr:palmitoleoyl-protein carboxylesterase NOTUM [Pteropus giganteus]